MEPEDWPCDIIEAHVAMIYSDNLEVNRDVRAD
jgi:hypothetical protein